MTRPKATKFRKLVVAVVAVLIAGACAGTEPRTDTLPEPTVAEAAAATTAPNNTTPYVRRALDRPAPPFTLIDVDGRSVELGDFAGKWVLIDWVFTNCVTFCPLLTGEMNQVHRGLEEVVGNDVHLVTITFDPTRDTPQALKTYASSAARSSQGWTWLTGTAEQTDAVAAAYGVAFDPIGPVNGIDQFQHTSLLVVIGPDGRERYRYLGTGWAEDVIELFESEILPATAAGTPPATTTTQAEASDGAVASTADVDELLDQAIALPFEDWERESGVIEQVLYQFPDSGSLVGFIDTLSAGATAGGAEVKRRQLSAMDARLIYWGDERFSGVGYTTNLAVVVEGETMRAVTDALAALDNEWCCGLPG